MTESRLSMTHEEWLEIYLTTRLPDLLKVNSYLMSFLLVMNIQLPLDSQLDSKIESSDLGIYEEINDDFIKESIMNRNKFQKLNYYQSDYLKRILDRKLVSISSLAKEFSICKSTLYWIKHWIDFSSEIVIIKNEERGLLTDHNIILYKIEEFLLNRQTSTTIFEIQRHLQEWLKFKLSRHEIRRILKEDLRYSNK